VQTSSKAPQFGGRDIQIIKASSFDETCQCPSHFSAHTADCQEVDEETLKMNAMSAALRRICTPKPTSGKLDVNQEVYKQWKQGGSQRKALLEVLIKSNGDKDQHMFSYSVWFVLCFLLVFKL